VTGQPLAHEIDTRILAPLHMDATSVAASSEIPSPYSHGYVVNGDTLIDATMISPSIAWGQGDVISTAGDLSTFFDALSDGVLLPPELLAEMQAVNANEGSGELGLGLQQVHLPCATLLGHGGDIPGYYASAFNDLEHDRQFVLLENSVTFDDKVGGPESVRLHDQLATDAVCS
jgi:D-alanyl-D-alanine carboxypeptidase